MNAARTRTVSRFMLVGLIYPLAVGLIVALFVFVLPRIFASKERLSYRVFEPISLTRRGLQEFPDEAGIQAFSLNLDDPILLGYYLVKVELTNEGISQSENLDFELSLGDDLVKIIDVKHKIVSPEHKVIAFSHSLPRLNWSFEKSQMSGDLFWTPGGDHVAGYNIFYSPHRSGGYGRINRTLIKQPPYAIPSFLKAAPEPSFFKIQAVGRNGLLSPFGKPLQYPAVLAFGEYFDGAIWISPIENRADSRRKSNKHVYQSLAEALKKEDSAATFVVDAMRHDLVSSNATAGVEVPKNTYYLDDLQFLKGKTYLTLPFGIDGGATVAIFILCKALELSSESVSLSLLKHPDITLVERKGPSPQLEPFGPGHQSPQDRRLALTPVSATPVVSDDSIYLIWEMEKGRQHDGIRIFRSEAKLADQAFSQGQEIFDGPGGTGDLGCRVLPIPIPDATASIEKPSTGYDTYPPPRKHEDPPPDAPTGLHVSYVVVSKHRQDNGTLAFFFEDKKVVRNTGYLYTIYTYHAGQYSYPIRVNASLDDTRIYTDCSVATGQEE